MNILFDQGTPVPLRQHLSEHTITTAYERGWAKLANGELLAHAEADGIDLLITTVNRNESLHHYAGPRRMQVWRYNQHEGGASFQAHAQLAFVHEHWGGLERELTH